jgi:circadian clock protein KaiC
MEIPVRRVYRAGRSPLIHDPRPVAPFSCSPRFPLAPFKATRSDAGPQLPTSSLLPAGAEAAHRIEGFDDICQGGLPIGRSTLISGTSGTGKTVFSLNFLYNGIRQFDEPGIFVTFEESPLDILRNAASFGWRPAGDGGRQDKLFLLGCLPGPGGARTSAGSFDLSGLIERINDATREYKARRVAIDSITAAFQQYDWRPGGAARDLPADRSAQGDRRHHGDDDRAHRRVRPDRPLRGGGVRVRQRRRSCATCWRGSGAGALVEILKLRGTTHMKGEFPFTTAASTA